MRRGKEAFLWACPMPGCVLPFVLSMRCCCRIDYLATHMRSHNIESPFSVPKKLSDPSCASVHLSRFLLQLWQAMGAYNFPEEMLARTFSFAVLYSDRGPDAPPGPQGPLSKSELQQCLTNDTLKVNHLLHPPRKILIAASVLHLCLLGPHLPQADSLPEFCAADGTAMKPFYFPDGGAPPPPLPYRSLSVVQVMASAALM